MTRSIYRKVINSNNELFESMRIQYLNYGEYYNARPVQLVVCISLLPGK